MTRVHQHHGKAAGSTSARTRRQHHYSQKTDQIKKAEVPNRKPSYKVVYEEIDAESKEKKLRTLLCSEKKAPPGYTFIPAGDPQITNRCKEEAMDDGLTVYVVSSAGDTQNGIAVQVHRLGYHFPSVSVDKACQRLGVSLTASGHVLQSRLAPVDHRVTSTKSSKRNAAKNKQKANQQQEAPKFNMTNLAQGVIDTQAREAIKDLFPKIPVDDLHTIIGRSFQKGKNLVGTASELTLVHRAQLAVLAHIRHCYTNYDTLLKYYKWVDARKMIEQICLDRIISWRGDEDDANKMDDILREVIIIDDDDDDDNDDTEMQEKPALLHNGPERESSLEIIPAEAMQTRAIDYRKVERNGRPGKSNTPDMDYDDSLASSGRRPSYLQQQSDYDQRRLDDMEEHRHRRYEEAVNRRRKDPIWVLDDSNDPTARTRATGQAPSYASQIWPQDSHGKEIRDDVAEAVSYHNSQPIRPVDSRLLPRETGRKPSEQVSPSHGSRKRESHASRSTVNHPFQQHQPLTVREQAQPTRDQYSSLAIGQPHETRLQHSSYADNERFARAQDTVYGMSDATYTHAPRLRPRRNSDFALPSIEGGFASPTSPNIPSRDHTQQGRPFALIDAANSTIPQMTASTKVHHTSFEEPPPEKKPRTDDHNYFHSQVHEKTVLVPLGESVGRYAMRQRSAETVSQARAQWPQIDSRIVPLPPKNAAGRQDVSRHEQDEDRWAHPLPRGHLQVSLSNAKARGQPPSLLLSDANHVASNFNSPNSFNASPTTASKREVYEYRPYLLNASGESRSGVRPFASSQPVAERSQRVSDAGGEMRSQLDSLAIGGRYGRNDEIGMSEDSMNRQLDYGYQRSHENIYMQRARESIERTPYQPSEPHSGRDVHYVPLRIKQETSNPFDRPQRPSELMSDTPRWAHEKTPTNTARLGNVRLAHQDLENRRHLNRGVPEEVIVLSD